MNGDVKSHPLRPGQQRILFGGSFDPPTRAHQQLVEIALAALPRAELVVIPAGRAPHKQGRHASLPEQRLAMARLAFTELPRVRVSDEEILRPETSWTVKTLERHRAQLGPDAQLYFLLGADSLLSFASWREPQRILSLAKILSVARPGFDLCQINSIEGLDSASKARLRAGILEGSGPQISSTDLRVSIQNGQRPGPEKIAAPVLAYIEAHGLYREPRASQRTSPQ